MKRSLNRSIEFLFLAYHGLVGALAGLVLVVLAFFAFPAATVGRELLSNVGNTLLVGSVFGLLYTHLTHAAYVQDLKYLEERERTGFRRLYRTPEDQEALDDISRRLDAARNVRVYGIAVKPLWTREILDKIRDGSKSKRLRFRALLADPESAQIRTRLAEEDEEGSPQAEQLGTIRNVVKRLQRIGVEINSPANFEIKLFSHYPTFALIIVDDEVYTYPYGFRTPGNIGPTLQLSGRSSAQARYYMEQFEILYQAPTNETPKS